MSLNLENSPVNAAKELAGKSILVTGASGFIGSHLCRTLHAHGAMVFGASRSERHDNDFVHKWLIGDLSSTEDARRLFKQSRPAVVFHLASHVFGARKLDQILPTFNSNLLSTVNILIAAADFGCNKVVTVGSLEEPELNDVAVPSSPYAAAKWSASAYARMFHALFDTPVSIARVFMVYGPEQKDLNKLVPYVILSALKGQPPKLSSGNRLVDWIYVQDVVDGLIRIAITAGIEGKTIDIGSGTLVAIKDIVEKTLLLVNPKIEPRYGAIPERTMEQTRVADANKSLQLINWKAETTLEEGLKKTISWYRSLSS